jgi:hypothetical protein
LRLILYEGVVANYTQRGGAKILLNIRQI